MNVCCKGQFWMVLAILKKKIEEVRLISNQFQVHTSLTLIISLDLTIQHKSMQHRIRSSKQKSMLNSSIPSISDISLSLSNESSFYLPDTIKNIKKQQDNIDNSVFSETSFDSFTFNETKQQQEEEVEVKVEENAEETDTISILPPEDETFIADPALIGIQANLSMSVKDDENNEEQETPIDRQRIIKHQMMEIDKKIKKLNADKNRLKHQLKVCGNQAEGQENVQLKECVCCGKPISKLCFRCDHLYCRPETCPRKKKQALNARMLEKMREKKGVSKKTQLERKKRDKKAQKPQLPPVDEEEQESFNDSSNLNNSSIQNSNNSSEETVKKESRQNETFSLNESQMFSSMNESGLFFDADE